MPKLRHSSAMLHSCLSHSTTKARRCSMGDISFQGTDPPQVRTVGVTHVLGPVCHPCARSVPCAHSGIGGETWVGCWALLPRCSYLRSYGLRPLRLRRGTRTNVV